MYTGLEWGNQVYYSLNGWDEQGTCMYLGKVGKSRDPHNGS